MAVNLNVISQFDAKGLNRAQSELDKLAASTSSISTKLSGAAKVAGAGILVGAGAVAAGLFEIGSSFDEAFDNIRIGTGATGPVLEALQADMKAVAGAVPASFGDAGKAVTVFSQKLGLTGAPLQTLSSQVLELSRMTGTDLGGNLTAVTDVFNNFGVGAGEQSGKLDLLFRASQASGVSVAELAGTMSGAGVVLREVGLSFDQSAGFLATLAKAGVDAGDVMPALSKSLATAAKQGKDASSVFTDTFNAIKGAPNDVAASGIALDVFGAKAGPKLAALIREGKLSYEDMTAAIAGGGETILGASADTQDFAEKLTILKNRVFLAIEPIATRVFNKIGEVMDDLGPKVDELTKFMSEHKDMMMVVAGVLGGIMIIVLTAYTISMLAAIAATVAAAAPFIAIGVAIGAMVAAAIYLWRNWNQVFKWIMDHKAYAAIILILGSVIIVPIVLLVGIIKWLQANWETVWSKIQAVTKIAVSITVTYFTALIEYVKFMWNIFQILSDVVQNVFSAIVTIIGGAWGFIKGVFDTIKGGIFDLVMFFLGIPGYIGGIGAGIANAIGDGFKAAWNSIAGLINRVIPDNVGFGFGPEIDLPDNPVPTFAKGGIFNAAMNGGSGLAVLHDNEMILNPQQQKALFSGKGLGGGPAINVTINTVAGDPDAIERVVIDAIARASRRGATVLVP
jgi:TP901 family phage tail tape measure protein